jgi:hypothetical protein
MHIIAMAGDIDTAADSNNIVMKFKAFFTILSPWRYCLIPEEHIMSVPAAASADMILTASAKSSMH